MGGSKTVGTVGWGHIIKGLVNSVKELRLTHNSTFQKLSINSISVSHSKLGDIKEMVHWLESLCSKERLHERANTLISSITCIYRLPVARPPAEYVCT